MAHKKAITIRFDESISADMELYRRLEKDAGDSMALAAVVKEKLRNYYDMSDMHRDFSLLKDELMQAIREEIQGLKYIGGNSLIRQDALPMNESALPDISDKIPEGALDFLK